MKNRAKLHIFLQSSKKSTQKSLPYHCEEPEMTIDKRQGEEKKNDKVIADNEQKQSPPHHSSLPERIQRLQNHNS